MEFRRTEHLFRDHQLIYLDYCDGGRLYQSRHCGVIETRPCYLHCYTDIHNDTPVLRLTDHADVAEIFRALFSSSIPVHHDVPQTETLCDGFLRMRWRVWRHRCCHLSSRRRKSGRYLSGEDNDHGQPICNKRHFHSGLHLHFYQIQEGVASRTNFFLQAKTYCILHTCHHLYISTHLRHNTLHVSQSGARNTVRCHMVLLGQFQ